MYKKLGVLLLLLSALACNAQVTPAEGRQLHYRIIGFSFPPEVNAVSYQLEAARGICEDEMLFTSRKCLDLSSKSNRIIGEVPDFGMPYTWRVITLLKNGQSKKSAWHHFGTGLSASADTAKFRLTVQLPAEKYKDALVFMNKNSVLYDMKGNPVWYLPPLPGIPVENTSARDIKLTPQGTITLLSGASIYEISYDGEILWKGPDNGVVSGEQTEHYHHEFTRLPDGHYMVMGNEIVNGIESGDSTRMAEIPDIGAAPVPGGVYSKQTFTTLIEYDEKGSVVWSWKASDFFRKARMHERIIKIRPELSDLHENSFYFSTKTNYIYLGVRNTNQIWKISYPAGVTERIYGNTGSQGGTMFSIQHGLKISKDGNIYLLNNNACSGCLPKVVTLQESPGEQQLKKIWEYQLPRQYLATAEPGKAPLSGGNVTELENNDMFVSMCDPYGNLFIVSAAKKLLWSAVFEMNVPATGRWQPVSQYRASIVENRKALESMIWYNKSAKP